MASSFNVTKINKCQIKSAESFPKKFLGCRQHSSFLSEDLTLHRPEGDALGVDGHVADGFERFDPESSNRDQLDTRDPQMSGVLKQI